MAYYYYTFNNKKYLKLLKLCMRPFQVAGTGMNLKDLMRFNFKDKWRTKEQDSISIAVHPGPELSSSCRPQAVRRGPPQGPLHPPEAGPPLTGDPTALTTPSRRLCFSTRHRQLHGTAAPGFIILAGRSLP